MAITRTHFAYRIDLWTDDEKAVVEHLADVDDLTVALATYHAAIERWPGKAITLRQGRHCQAVSRERPGAWPGLVLRRCCLNWTPERAVGVRNFSGRRPGS